MIKIIFLLAIGTLALLDYRKSVIPNIIVLPCIAAGIYLTKNWQWAMILFLLSWLLYHREKWAGGDVKLMAMIGAFLGMKALFIFSLVFLSIYLFRRIRNYNYALPVTPFAFFVSLLFIL